MQIELLKKLRASTQAWHYHRRLREQGDTTEAARRERESIRRDINTMRDVLDAHAQGNAYMSLGDYGSSVNWSNADGSCQSAVQGYGLDHVAIMMPLLAMGVPMIDMRGNCGVDVALKMPLVALPASKADPEDRWAGGWGYAPLPYALKRARELGAKIVNA